MGQTNCLWNSRRITSRTGEQRYFSFHDTRLNSKLFFSFHIYNYTLYHSIVDDFFPQKLTDGRYIPAAVFLSLKRVAKTDDISPVVKFLLNFTEGEQQILFVLVCQSIGPSIHRSIDPSCSKLFFISNFFFFFFPFLLAREPLGRGFTLSASTYIRLYESLFLSPSLGHSSPCDVEALERELTGSMASADKV